MHGRVRLALGLSISFTAAALALACGSSSDDTAAGSPDGSVDARIRVDAFREVDTGSSDATKDAYVYFGDAGPGHQLGTGGSHTCFIRPDRTVRCWGSNSKGQLGNGVDDGGKSAVPVDVIGITDAVELAGGGEFTCARLASGGVKCWGDGNVLGNDGDSGAMSSKPVDVVGLVDAVQIAAGVYHACALRANHHVVCWGADSGRLGDGNLGGGPLPVEPVKPNDAGGNIDDAIAVACGWGHTCIAHMDGSVTCSGEYQPWGQLGDGTNQDRYTPVEVQNMAGAVSVGAGLYTSFALLADGGVMQAWGNNQTGSLGLGTTDQNLNGSPMDVPGMTSIAELAPSGWGSCAVTTSHTGYCWGDFVATSNSPTPVTTSGPIAEISGGESHACARMISGEVQCWGSNYAGQLGSAADGGGQINTPVTVPGL